MAQTDFSITMCGRCGKLLFNQEIHRRYDGGFACKPEDVKKWRREIVQHCINVWNVDEEEVIERVRRIWDV